jgi:solute carrier family 24 (sodium/potassium/calcium exchanger), member 6
MHVCVFFSIIAGTEHETWIFLGTAASSLVLALVSVLFSKYAEHPMARLARCSMGFVVAVVWIRVIADEVVNVLQVREAEEIFQA